MKTTLKILMFILIGFTAKAQLPSSTFPSRIFNGNTKAQWLILDSPVVNPILDTFNARYPGTQIVRIQGGDTAFWFGAGGHLWFRSLLDRDTISLSNRINLKLNISDTTNKWWGIGKRWVDTVYWVNDSTIGFTINGGPQQTFEIKGRASGGGGSGTVTSVGLSMPSAFNVTPLTITTSGTFNVSGAGTAAEYIRGNGTLGTTDTSMIPNFHLKVRSLFSGTSPITFNQTTGAIGINNANVSGTKGAASFTGAFSDNGSGLIDLADLVSAGSCTGCNLNIDSKGRVTGYSDGAGGATNNVNIGVGYRPVNAITQEMRTYFAGFGNRLDTVSNANGITWSADTTRASGLPTYFYIDSLPSENISNTSLTANGNYSQNWSNKQWYIDSIAGQFLFRMGGIGNTGTRRKEFRINWGGSSFGDNLDGYNMMSVVKKADNSADSLRLGLISSGTGTLSMGTFDVANSGNNTFISYSVLGLLNLSAKDSIWIKGATPAATADSILGVQFRSVNGTSRIVKIPTPSGGGGGATLNNIGSGFRFVATPSGNIKTSFPGYGILKDSTTNTNGITDKVDTNTVDNRYFNVVRVTDQRFAGGAVGDSVTDCTAAIQAAINYVHEHGGGTISFPAGYYSVGGPILPIVNGSECNGQLYLPYSSSDSAIVIRFIAEAPVDFEMIGIDGMPVSKKGVIIASSLTGQSDSTFILSALKGPGSGTFTKMNQTTPYFEGIGFRVRVDGGTNGQGGLNLKFASKVWLDKVKIDINMPIFNMPDVTGWGSIGLLLPERGNHASIGIGTLRIGGFDLGMDIQEHMVAQDLQIVVCNRGAIFEGGDHSSSIQTLEVELNKTNLVMNAPGKLVITNFNSEHYTTADKWFEFENDITFPDNSGRVTITEYSASNSGTGSQQYQPTTDNPELITCLNCRFETTDFANFQSVMLGERDGLPGRGIMQINDRTAVLDAQRFGMYNSSGHIVWSFFSTNGGTETKVLDFTQDGLNVPVVNWMASTFKIGSVYSGGLTDAKLEVTTPGDVGMRINMSKTTDGVTAVQFNRASTSVENSFNWATNGTNKWFLGQDNDATDNLHLYSWTANKFVSKLYDATGDIGFGNTANDLYIKNGSAVMVGTALDNGVGKLQVDGKLTVATHSIGSNSDSAVVWDRTTNEYKVAAINSGGSVPTLYSDNGSLAGNRIVTGGNNNLTFNGMFNYRVNANSFVLDKTSATAPYSMAVVGAYNGLQIGYTPTPATYSKGIGVVVDTNNNVGLGVQMPTSAPRYATGANTYIDNMMVEGGQYVGVTSITANTTIDLEKHYIRIDATSGNVTVTLPAASSAFGASVGIHYVFKRLDNSGNTITITRAGSDTIDGGTSITLTTQYEVKELQCSSTSTWDVR